MNILIFQHNIYEVAGNSSLCKVPIIRSISSTSISIRIYLTIDGFIEIFYNEQSYRIAYAFIQNNFRIYGADNTGGWHIHPFSDPSQHLPSPKEISFSEFIKEIEKYIIYWQ